MAINLFGTTIPREATSFYDFSQNDDGEQPGATAIQDDGGSGTHASPTQGGNGGSSSSSTTTDTTGANPYARFKGNNYEELEKFLRGQMESIKPETKAEREKRERREKRVGFLARLADGLGALHTAYSHARGVKPMETPNVSAKARELFEKARAQREKDNDRLMNYYMTLGNIKDKERDFDFRVTHAGLQQDNWQRQFDAGRKDREEDVAFRKMQFDAGRQDRKEDVAFRDKQFEEGRRQFNVSSAEQRRHNMAAEGLERQRFAASQDGNYTEFYSGDGIIRIPNNRLNQHNISYVFSKTPSAGRPTGGYNASTGQTTPVSADQMMDWIGAHIDDPNVQSALRAIGVETPTKKKPLPGNNGIGAKKSLP